MTSTGGHIWAFNGRTGADQGAFPFRTHGRIMAPALLVDLRWEIFALSFTFWFLALNLELPYGFLKFIHNI